jgi:hypothetical protein
MSWEAERTTQFDEWWKTLTDSEQRRVVASVEALEELGPTAGRPLVDSVQGSQHSNIKELRVGRTIRIFFAFDPQQIAILLIGGDKAGRTKRFYKQMIRKADRIYQEHLDTTRTRHNEARHEDEGDEEIQRTQRGGP